jgi:hypothetical protein
VIGTVHVVFAVTTVVPSAAHPVIVPTANSWCPFADAGTLMEIVDETPSCNCTLCVEVLPTAVVANVTGPLAEGETCCTGMAACAVATANTKPHETTRETKRRFGMR